MILLDPKKYYIKSKTIIEDRGDKICILINQKSRMIMKDGMRILRYAEAAQQATQKQITVETREPVCGKTKTYLWNHRVLITTTNQNTTNEK